MNRAILELREPGYDWVAVSGWNVSVSFDSWDREITPSTGNYEDDGDAAYDQYGELLETGMDIVCKFNGFDIAGAKMLIDTIYPKLVDKDNDKLELRYYPQGKEKNNTYIFPDNDARVDNMTVQCVNRPNKIFIILNFHVKTSGFNYEPHG